jgi:hypothetical protein
MNLNQMSGRRTPALLAAMLAGASFLNAADDAKPAAVPAAPANAVTSGAQSQNDEIARLQAALAAQQKQLEMLQKTLEQQQKLLQSTIDSAAAPQRNTLGTVASLTPVVPAPAPAPFAFPAPRPQMAPAAGGNPCEAGVDTNTVPPYLRIGSTCVVPIGFMDLTSVWRDKNAGSSMGSNFGSVPYNNSQNGNLSEFRFSPQNSRIGFRIDGDWKGTHFIGYNEFDFNGTSASNGIVVNNGAFVPRLRLFWVDARKGKVEFLAGQSWSLLTPNRKGLSALPGDLFYTQVVDINYVAGLTWTRQPGMRVIFHPNDKVTFGLSAEQPDQYGGGSAGGSTITAPTAGPFTTVINSSSSQIDTSASLTVNGQSILAQPTVSPDFIAKVAFDPNSRFHIDLAGLESNFKIVNPSILSQHFGKTGGGVELGWNVELFKGFRLINTDYWSDGGGRYLFGQAPDLIVRGDGSLSLIHSGGFIGGFEDTIKNTLLYAYYTGIYIGKDVAVDSAGKLIGYGPISSDGQNRVINEVTFGFNQTMWKNPRYGAINLMGQYEWLEREPWFASTTAPKNTHDNTIYVNVRYTLPGSMPNF